MTSNRELGLYLHVPFCAAKCAYCDFYSLPGRADAFDAYTDHLCAQLCGTAPRAADFCVDTVYLGGGTPSLLGGARIARILRTVRERYALTPDAEITVEANPDSMTDEFLSAAREAGANRLSVGVQSAREDELRLLGRVHTFAQARDAVIRAKQAGFDNLSLDLMYALPGQTADRLTESLDALLALEPRHISCYGLTLEPGTPLAKSEPVLPDEDAQAELYLLLCGRLRQAGFLHYEISNFARPGFASRHNSRYWRQSPYLGFGPGAHGDFGGTRYFWPRALDIWLAGKSELRTEDNDIDRAAEYTMLSLRTADGWDADAYHGYGRDPAPVLHALLALPERLIRRTENGAALTDEGFLVSNAIIAAALAAGED